MLNKSIGVIKNDKITLDINLSNRGVNVSRSKTAQFLKGFIGKAQIYREEYKLVVRDKSVM